MKTKINWKVSTQNDWTGIELIDAETGETHATIDGCTPEALALIGSAPELLRELKYIVARPVTLRLEDRHFINSRKAIKKAEGR